MATTIIAMPYVQSKSIDIVSVITVILYFMNLQSSAGIRQVHAVTAQIQFAIGSLLATCVTTVTSLGTNLTDRFGDPFWLELG